MSPSSGEVLAVRSRELETKDYKLVFERPEVDNRPSQLIIAAVVQVSKLVWKLKTLRLSHSPTNVWM